MKKPKRLVCHPDSRYLLFWPVFWLRYLLLEQYPPRANYHVVHCALDDRIPFLEGFIIPYLLWHLCIVGIHLWLYTREDPAFEKYSRYLMVAMGISTAVFVLYPTCQNLRLTQFPRENALTKLVQLLYRMDTSTNVCPSEHVIGAVGFFLAVRGSQKPHPGTTVLAGVLACLTAVATVFLKQHSVLDVLAALPVCFLGWAASFGRQSVSEYAVCRRIRNHFGRSSA